MLVLYSALLVEYPVILLAARWLVDSNNNHFLQKNPSMSLHPFAILDPNQVSSNSLSWQSSSTPDWIEKCKNSFLNNCNVEPQWNNNQKGALHLIQPFIRISITSIVIFFEPPKWFLTVMGIGWGNCFLFCMTISGRLTMIPIWPVDLASALGNLTSQSSARQFQPGCCSTRGSHQWYQ